MNKNFILGYWDCRGLAEPIRLFLEYLDLPYTEDKYSGSFILFDFKKMCYRQK